MKISDVFDREVKASDIRIYRTVGVNPNYDDGVAVYEAAAHAINCHDQLTDALAFLIDAINNPSPEAHEQVCYAEKLALEAIEKARG